MKKFCLSLRGALSLIVSASLLTVPVPPAYAGDGGSSRRVSTGNLLPPGIPVPGVNVPVFVPVPKHRGKRLHKYRPHYGTVYRTLPAGVFTLTVGGGTFFYHFGTYYRHIGDGYVVVKAPIGARVRILPDDCSTLYVDGIRYYECGDVYYESAGGEYVVIEGPPRGDRWPEAEIGEEVWIKADTLNIRSGPGKHYQVIDRLYRGDVVEVSGKEGDWYHIRLRGGSYGWILKEYARPYRHMLHDDG